MESLTFGSLHHDDTVDALLAQEANAAPTAAAAGLSVPVVPTVDAEVQASLLPTSPATIAVALSNRVLFAELQRRVEAGPSNGVAIEGAAGANPAFGAAAAAVVPAVGLRSPVVGGSGAAGATVAGAGAAAAGTSTGAGPVQRGPVAHGVALSDSDEVIKLNIAAPKFADAAESKYDPREISSRARAFVRDIGKYFALVKGGNRDEARCLFLASALEGRAKAWHDEWTLSRPVYTSEQLLSALLVRFAPQIQSREVETRDRLSTGKYRMRPGETVSSYQSRFEALLTNIPTATDGDRMYWFLRGLVDDLLSLCQTDEHGHPFRSYAALVSHTLGKELQLFASKQSRSAALRFNFLSAQLSSDDEAVPKRRRRNPTAARGVGEDASSEGG